MQFSTEFVRMFGTCETPASYLRWSAISMLSAAIGRKAHLVFGDAVIYPNTYIILIGSPGARKATGIRMVKKVLKASGYKNFAPDKARKEALWEFMEELCRPRIDDGILENEVEEISFDDILGEEERSAEVYILAGELVAFIAPGDDEFIDSLTDMWDNLSDFSYKRATKRDVTLKFPTINLLGATTQSSFSRIIPAHAIGGGFMRRMILVHGELNSKITWPDKPDIKIFNKILDILNYLSGLKEQEISVIQEGQDILHTIYQADHFLKDRRFEHYVSVRLTHLLKLCIISACARKSITITPEDIIASNTHLARAELNMPNSIGHFGYAKNSTTTSVVLNAITQAKRPPSLLELYKMVGTDVGSKKELQEHIKVLIDLDKVRRWSGARQGKEPTGAKYIAHTDSIEGMKEYPYVDTDYLLDIEKV